MTSGAPSPLPMATPAQGVHEGLLVSAPFGKEALAQQSGLCSKQQSMRKGPGRATPFLPGGSTCTGTAGATSTGRAAGCRHLGGAQQCWKWWADMPRQHPQLHPVPVRTGLGAAEQQLLPPHMARMPVKPEPGAVAQASG